MKLLSENSSTITFFRHSQDLPKRRSEHPHHVAAENLADAFGRIVSSSEFGLQVFPVEEFGADVVAAVDAVLAPVAFFEFRRERRQVRRDAFGVFVRAVPIVLGRYSDMVDADEFHAIVDPVCILADARVRAHVLANHPAFFRRGDDQRIRCAAASLEQVSARRVAEDHRLLGGFQCFHRRAVAGVGQINDDTELVHPSDRFLAKRSEAGIDFTRIAAAVVAVFIEGQRETAQAEIEEGVEQAQAIAQRFGILQAE